jgi:hypothetical protein
MQIVNELHQKAMELADRAAEARRAGDVNACERLTAEALKHEAEAAWKVARESDIEPTRSVLFRSAATLAIECRELRVAEQLIGGALSGTPPQEIAEELRDLLEEVYFQRHLEVRGVTLAPDEVQMTLEGDAVGFGMARSDAFLQRVGYLGTLIYRTAERLQGRPFRVAGRKKRQLAETLELYLSVPRAASFAVTLRLGQRAQMEMDLPGVDLTSKTMKEVLFGLDLVSRGDSGALQERISDEDYRLNFIGLAECLAPDGQDIRSVGFTTTADQGRTVVALATPRKQMRVRMRNGPREMPPETRGQHIEMAPEAQGQHIEIQGTLLEADATKQKEGIIEVVDKASQTHKVVVPRGMMSDIVKPMFEEEVIVSAILRGTRLHLESIDLVESDDKTG